MEEETSHGVDEPIVLERETQITLEGTKQQLVEVMCTMTNQFQRLGTMFTKFLIMEAQTRLQQRSILIDPKDKKIQKAQI